jgi:hypothetical protein
MTLSVMQNIVMMSVDYDECHIQAHFAESHNAECHYAKCRSAECRGAAFVTSSKMAKN